MDTEKYNVILVGITKEGKWLLVDSVKDIEDGSWREGEVKAFISPDTTTRSLVILAEGTYKLQKVDVIFPVLHGMNGEDGTVQGLFELSKIPYVGCGVLASAVSMDKVYTKIIVDHIGIDQAKFVHVRESDFVKLGTLNINRTVCRISCGNGHTKVVIQTPKTRTSRREIPIPKQLSLMLKKLRGSASNAAWFLSGSESKPTEPRCYRKSIKAYLKQATVRQVRPHALRHTFATTCLQAGCDVKTLSELLGHANANITLQRYVHSDLTRKRREMNRIFSRQVSMRGRKALNLLE